MNKERVFKFTISSPDYPALMQTEWCAITKIFGPLRIIKSKQGAIHMKVWCVRDDKQETMEQNNDKKS